MKKLLFTLITVFSLSVMVNAQVHLDEISINELEAKMKEEPRFVIMDFYTSWCGPCRMMDQTTFHNAEVAAYLNEHFYVVKFNAEGNEEVSFKGQTYTNPSYDPAKARGRNGTHQFTTTVAPHNGRIAYPTVVFWTNEMQLLTKVQGFIQPTDMMPFLVFIAEGHYLNTPYEEFLKNYQNAK